MKIIKSTSKAAVAALIATVWLAVGGLQSAVAQDQVEHAFGFKQANVLEVIARHPPDEDADAHYEFVLSDHEIPAGWTTIRQVNDSSATHFVYMIRLPDEQAEITLEEYMDAVTMPFQAAWDPYFAGEHDVNEFFGNLIPALPEWFFDATPSGGPGFLGGNRTGWTTMNLAPGTYILECYIMDADGIFHSAHGMLERLVVTEDQSAVTAPEADLQVSVSTTGGLVFDAENLQPGRKTFEVTFEDNMPYGHGQGHDVHLVRLDGDTTVDDINVWMNYLDVGADGFYANRGALVSASGQRGPKTLIGGVQSLFPSAEAGQTAYFHATLRPGRYVLVAEVPNPMQPDPDNPEMSMLVEFSVTPFAGLTGAWFDPQTQGQGWNFVAAPHGVFGYFYGYSNSGDPLWLVTEEVIDQIRPGEAVTYNLLHASGGSFFDPVPSEDLERWGEVVLTFENCDQATAEISGIDGAVVHQLERLSHTAGLEDCAL